MSDGFGYDILHEGDFKFLKLIESKTNQFEIVFKSLALFSTQFNVKECFKLLLAIRVKKFGDKSRNSLVTNKTLNFSGPCRRVRPAKLTNQRAYQLRDIVK